MQWVKILQNRQERKVYACAIQLRSYASNEEMPEKIEII